MPRLRASAHFRAGFISARMADLWSILDQLRSAASISPTEMQSIRERIASIDVNVRMHHRDIDDPLVRPKLREYDELLEMTFGYLARREANDGRQVPETEAMRAARLRKDDLDMYASDGTHEIPIERMSVVTVTPRFRPISAADLRAKLDRQRAGETLWGYEPQDSQAPGNAGRESNLPRSRNEPQREAPARRLVPIGDANANQSLYGGVRFRWSYDRDQSEARGRSRSRQQQCNQTSQSHDSSTSSSTYSRSSLSHASYESSRQEVFSRPRNRVTFPPMGTELPHEIRRDDPNIVGMSELYVHHPTGDRSCPLCPEMHRMIRCPVLLQSGLVLRWFRALRAGVCLNCLRRGHSSFTCYTEGACKQCGVRHNSLLCPRHPLNK